MIFFCLLLFVFLGISVLTFRKVPALKTKDDLTSFDFTKGVGKINRNLFEFYPEKLYSPEDFAAGKTGEPAFTVDSENNKERQLCPYGTYRLVLSLPEGVTFAMGSDSATYAQKVWVNGTLVSEFGKVSSRKEDFIPRTGYYTACFTAGKNPTEIVVQQANFVHWSGTLFEVDMGPQNDIYDMITKKLFRTLLALGMMLTASIIFFGIGLFFPGRRQYLWFSFGCLSLCIRSSFVSPKPVMILFPQLNWYFGHKLEHIMLQTALLFMLLFYNEIFPNLVNRIVRYAGYILAAVGIAMYAFLPSTVYSPLTQKDVNCMIVYFCLYMALFLFGFFRKRKEYGGTGNFLMMTGVIILNVSCLMDAFRYRRDKDYNLSQSGMLIFIFITSIALTMELLKVQEELNEAAAREEKMRLTNQTLTELHEVRSEFMSDLSHELRTPLTVMSNYAGLTRLQIAKNNLDESTTGNLEIIEKEAVRLGTLVEQLKDISSDRVRKISPVRGDVKNVLLKAADFCKPICEKNHNRIEINVPEKPLYAMYIPESILQVLYNLITNANRHGKNGCIRLKAENEGAFVSVEVEDAGNGISPDILPHIFERGVSGDNSTGLGLSICRDIIETGGGEIMVKRTSSSGTVFRFTIPAE